jgi:hypothetical protein
MGRNRARRVIAGRLGAGATVARSSSMHPLGPREPRRYTGQAGRYNWRRTFFSSRRPVVGDTCTGNTPSSLTSNWVPPTAVMMARLL